MRASPVPANALKDQSALRTPHFRNAFMAGIKKILLAQMTKFRTEVAGDFQMVVDDQADVGAARDGQDFFRHAPDFIRRGFFGAKLDQITAAVTKL